LQKNLRIFWWLHTPGRVEHKWGVNIRFYFSDRRKTRNKIVERKTESINYWRRWRRIRANQISKKSSL
jgi:hypothetical protein